MPQLQKLVHMNYKHLQDKQLLDLLHWCLDTKNFRLEKANRDEIVSPFRDQPFVVYTVEPVLTDCSIGHRNVVA